LPPKFKINLGGLVRIQTRFFIFDLDSPEIQDYPEKLNLKSAGSFEIIDNALFLIFN